MPLLEKDYLYDYTFEDLVEFYKGDKRTAKSIYDEIQFCKMMHNLRPQQWEKDIVFKEKKYKIFHFFFDSTKSLL